MKKLHIKRLFESLYRKDKQFVINLYHEFHNDISSTECKQRFVLLVSKFKQRSIIVYGFCESEKYLLEYSDIIHYLTQVLNNHVRNELGIGELSVDGSDLNLYKYYDLLMEV